MPYKSPRYTQDAINRYRNHGNKIDCPNSSGPSRGQVHVKPSGKPPKLRFQPGTHIELEGQLYLIMYAYRTQENPHEWCFCLEERIAVDQALDEIGQIAEAMRLGSTTPRVVYEVFRNDIDAHRYFADIPRNGDSILATNKRMLKGKVIEDGAT